jgi:hypothetical protein
MNNPDDYLADCYLLLLKEEYEDDAGVSIARLYYNAF